MDLLNLCLTSSYFQYNGNQYKLFHVLIFSRIKAETVKQNVEKQALVTYKWTPPIWFRSFDDALTDVNKDAVGDFHEHLIRKNVHLQFIKEIEENGKIPIVDYFLTSDDNNLWTTMFKENPHTLTDYWNSHPTFLLLTNRQLYGHREYERN